jgi:hypothetical protein
MVARHEVPGIRPINDPSRRVRYDAKVYLIRNTSSLGADSRGDTNHNVPSGRIVEGCGFQAFHAWLPSGSPYWTEPHSPEKCHGFDKK